MANDIQTCISANNIKNSTILVATCAKNGANQTINTYVSNKPTISDIESKYDNRFDDVDYYSFGNSNVIGT